MRKGNGKPGGQSLPCAFANSESGSPTDRIQRSAEVYHECVENDRSFGTSCFRLEDQDNIRAVND